MRPVEKNWVLFTHKSNIKVIYQWYPLTIGEFSKNTDVENTTTTFVTTNTIQTPAFFKRLRGSTNGVIIGDDIWFITHIVSDENRRYYYHIFVVLDKTTNEVKKYSSMFSFEKEKIEYTLGFAYMEQSEQFIIGYSTNDCTTQYMAISKKYIDNLF
jgi:aryl-phospho-beta-D-glucosidase BglC (GH1 family)